MTRFSPGMRAMVYLAAETIRWQTVSDNKGAVWVGCLVLR